MILLIYYYKNKNKIRTKYLKIQIYVPKAILKKNYIYTKKNILRK